MSETAFPINDLIRRRLQTTLTVFSLTASVASTLFLLLFSGQLGFGIASQAQNTLTRGNALILGQFLTFVGVLIFVVGAIVVSFIVFLMMAQRTRDYGLMKATGCPNGLVFGYFLTELLAVTFLSCVLGTIVGIVVDYAVINTGIFEVYNKTPNLWFAPLVFVAYFVFALVFGARPILNAARTQPIKALSAVQYYGLGKGSAFKPLSKTALTIRMASRSIFRRKSATVRIVVFLSAVFMLLTVSIAGGIIANDTSASWLKEATGENVLLIGRGGMTEQYSQLQRAFSGAQPTASFDYSSSNLAISEEPVQKIQQVPGVEIVDERLVWFGEIEEIAGYILDGASGATIVVGANRHGTSILVGVDVGNLVSTPYTTGSFLNATSKSSAVIGDSIAHTVYAPIGLKPTNPLVESIRINGTQFKIAGIAIDALNGGNVTYIPLDNAKTLTGLTAPNLVLVKVNSAFNIGGVKSQIESALGSDFSVIEMNPILEENTSFLGSLWAVIMFLPAFALAAATLSLVSFQMLTTDEQRQEFAVLRATGAKPRTIMGILAAQSATVLMSSFGVGISLGTIICVLILMANPVVSSFTVVAIAGWLLASLLVIFILSLYPAVKFARKPLPEIMS